MRINRLQAVNFRNYPSASLNFQQMVNVFYGKNGQGKTNLLEAVFYAAFAMSHRTSREDEMMRFGQQGMAVLADFEREDGPHSVQIKRYEDNGRMKKEIRIDKKRISAREHYGSLNVVMFSPEDLQIVKGEPALRRRFLDMEISQTDPLYYELLLKYNRSLRQRNKLLKLIREQQAREQDLAVWDREIARLNAAILVKRLDNLAKLQRISREIFHELSEQKEELELQYEMKGNNGQLLYPTAEDGRDWEAFCLESLEARHFKDIMQGSTGIGIHRDDLRTLINGYDSKAFGSQGQQRCCALALKLSQITYVKEESGEYPVLLLDDVMSELDAHRRKQLVGFINGKVQTFITVNDRELIPAFPENRYFEIDAGGIKEV